METVPVETLQLKALEQRRRLHTTAVQLREKVEQTRDKLRVSKQAREHLLAFCIGASVAGAAAGYGIAGVFTRNS